MAKITLKQITSEKSKKAISFNTDLFRADRESIENFNPSDFEKILFVDSQSTNDKLSESAIGFSSSIPYLISVNQTRYNGEKQISVSSQELTLKGFNYFFKKTKESQEDFLLDEAINFYNLELSQNHFDFTYEDVISLAEFKADLNCSILSLEDEEAKYYITVNSENLLSKITKKLKEEKKEEKQETKLTSFFG